MHKPESLKHYRRWYAWLLWLQPRSFHKRFGASMEQTFDDLLTERLEQGGNLFTLALWMYLDTFAGIIKEYVGAIMLEKKDMRDVGIGTAVILAIPLVAMQFSDEVVWTFGDFLIGGMLLMGTGLTLKLALKQRANLSYKAACGIAIFMGLFLIWMNLAVGIIGSENNKANLMYVGVIAVGVIGTMIARFRPRGMAKTLSAAALTQALIALIALFTGMEKLPGASVAEIVNINCFFVIMFVISALLFRHADRRITEVAM